MRALSAQSIQACRISTTDACRTSCQVLVRTVKAIGAGRPLRTWYSSCAATGRSGGRSGCVLSAAACWQLRCSPVDRCPARPYAAALQLTSPC